MLELFQPQTEGKITVNDPFQVIVYCSDLRLNRRGNRIMEVTPVESAQRLRNTLLVVAAAAGEKALLLIPSTSEQRSISDPQTLERRSYQRVSTVTYSNSGERIWARHHGDHSEHSLNNGDFIGAAEALPAQSQQLDFQLPLVQLADDVLLPVSELWQTEVTASVALLADALVRCYARGSQETDENRSGFAFGYDATTKLLKSRVVSGMQVSLVNTSA